jgi:hypothetical protein
LTRHRYTFRVASVADDLRDELREQVARLTGFERVALALKLGERDVAMYAQARCVDRETAAKVLAAARRVGRIRSACLEPRSD